MSWFEDQVNARRQSDRDALNEAYEAAVNAVIGESFSFDEAEDEITSILRFYGMQPVKLSDKLEEENEKLSAVCRITGLMRRRVRLEKGWYKNAFGAFLCQVKNSGEYVAVLPGKISGYSYYDRKNRKRVKLNRKTEKNLEVEAVCFYRPLPARKIGIFEVVKFGIQSWSVMDHILTYGMLAVITLIGLFMPKLSYFLYSTVIEEASVTLLASTLVFILSISISTLFLSSMQRLFSQQTGVKMAAAIESATMMRILSLPPNFFRQYSSGELVTRMGYIESASTQIVNMLFSTTLSSLFSLAYITQIFRFSKSLVVPSLCVILANVLFSVYSTMRQMKIARVQMQLGAKNNGKGIEMVSGIQKIKMAGAEKRIFARYTKAFSEQSKATYNPPFFNKYNTIISQTIALAGTIVIYYFSVSSHINVAEYYAFQTSYGMIGAALAGLAGIALQAAELRPSLEMAQPMLDAVPENTEKTEDVTGLEGNIELNNVTFRYEDNSANVIDDFSLKISAGQYIAIVGKTGCGKSTLVRLLLGFEKPQKGSIYYDGRDLNILEKRSLRRKIGTVMQGDKLFTGSIYSNIVICAPTLTMDRAWEAAEVAGIADDIREMPMGMHTLITEGSGGISGGQRQRIAIARAIAPKPKILIFDEATSALDNITQKKVADALDGLNCTRIVIAHRLSTIRHCDRILVMDKGRVVEDGSYDELASAGGYFAELVERQRLDK